VAWAWRAAASVNPSSDLVNKLWRLCSLLRKDGVTYQQYVTELTYLLFLK
jgi:type I restriction enzyme M protein